MDLSNLKPAKGSTHKRKRIGRGVGSGYGGHSSTKGNKGQKARAGASIPVWFEGGQMPLIRRVPKFGFKNPFRKEYRAINLSQLARLVEEGHIGADVAVTPEVLASVGLVRKADNVKILGGGELTTKLTIQAHAFSATAREKIEAAGGSVSVID
jgi:large subunit ribosomal protein L15